jgi:hypothetical protein
VPGELAAWRYGRQLIHRRRRYLVTAGAGGAVGIAAWGGLSAIGVGFFGMWMGFQWVQSRYNQKILHRIAPDDDPDGRGIALRRWHLPGLRLAGAGGAHDLNLEIRDAHRKEPGWRSEVNPKSKDIVVIRGEAARAALSRAMVHVNRQGATEARLRDADRILTEAGSAERVLLDAATGGAALGKKAGADPRLLQGPGALAFEMALHEESERHALEGELAALEAAWKEAEEIAAIADALPGEAALNRLLDRLVRTKGR